VTAPRYCDNGWHVGAVTPLAPNCAYSLLAPEATSQLNAKRLEQQAARFFDFTVLLQPAKHYPSGSWPRVDTASLIITRQAETTSIDLLTVPVDHAPAVMRAARAAVVAIGGAGFDVLLGRAKRVWQLGVAPDGDHRPALAAAALLASVLLAPVLPPAGDTIYGVKTARTQLAALS